MSPEHELNEAKRRLEIARLDRKISKEQRAEKMDTVEAWIAFTTSKAAGLTGLSLGGFEWLLPSVLPIELAAYAPAWAAAGFTLLAGKSVLKIVRDAADSVLKKMDS